MGIGRPKDPERRRMKLVAFRLPEELYKKLEAESKEKGYLSTSPYVRDILTGKELRPTVYTRLDEIIGRLDSIEQQMRKNQ